MAGGCADGLRPAGRPDAARRTLDQDSIAADWKFDQAYTSGSIAQGDLIIEDQSGNNNDLKMQVYNNGNQEQYISFNDSSMTGTGGSMVLNGDNDSKTGVDFITVDGAAINKETFPDGYTMEFIYYFPEDWTAADQWMSLIGRQGSNGGNPEGEQGTMYTSISNCKEIQFITGNAAGNHTMSSAAWSVSMDKGGVWYHIAVVSDGQGRSPPMSTAARPSGTMSAAIWTGCTPTPPTAASAWAPPGGTAWTSSSKAACRRSVSPKQRWRNRIGLSPTLRTMWKTSAATRDYQLRNEDNYNIVLIPDTQNMVEFRPDVMDNAIDGLINSADALNVAGVVHPGRRGG